MKKLILLLSLLLLFGAVSCSNQAAVVQVSKTIDVDQTYGYWQEDVVFLDVRELHEWDAGHIPGAIHIPLGELEDNLDDLPNDEVIVVVCRSGNRSTQGRDILLRNGFEMVTSMGGGMNAWAASGYDIEK